MRTFARMARRRGSLSIAFAPALVSTPYTPPTGIDAYGRGTTFATPWNLAGQTGTVRYPTTGAALQTALNDAAYGDVIVLDNAITYTANLSLPSKTFTTGQRIYVVSDTVYNGTFVRAPLGDPEGFWQGGTWYAWTGAKLLSHRARPSDAGLAVVQNATTSSGTLPVMTIETPSSWLAGKKVAGWHFAGVYFRPNTAAALTSDIMQELISIGCGSTTDQQPQEIIFDRCVATPLPAQNVRRILRPEAKFVAVINSDFGPSHNRNDGDTQAIAGWNGAQRVKIANNTLSAMGEVMNWGGDDSLAEALAVQDIEYRRLAVSSPKEAWGARGSLTAHSSHAASAYNGIDYSIKNLLEWKVGVRMWIEGIMLRNCRADGQSYAFVVKGEVQNANDPWVGTKDASFRHIRMDNTAGAFQIHNQFMSDPITTGGTITTATNATPIVITRSVAHGLVTGDVVRVGSGLGNTAMNGIWTITVVDSTRFSLDTSVGNGAYTGSGRYHVRPRVYGNMQFYNILCTNCRPVDSSVFVEGFTTRGIELSNSLGVILDRITIDGPFNRDGPLSLSGVPADFGSSTVTRFVAPRGNYGVTTAGSSGDDAVAATLGTPTWDTNIFWGSTAFPTLYDGVANTTLLANRSDVGFDADLAISGTYVASSVDRAELARFTDNLEIS